MRQVIAIAVVATTSCILCGCRPPPSGASSVPVPGGLKSAGTDRSETPQGVGGLHKVEPSPVVAAQNADRYWSQEEVEMWLRQDLKLAQVSLTPQTEHGLSGTGVGLNGRNYTLTVKQIPGGIKCWFKDDFGGSGDMAFGKMAEPPKPNAAP